MNKVVITVAILVLWGLCSENGVFFYFFSSPKETLSYFGNHFEQLLTAFAVTGFEANVGLLIAIALAYLMGTICLYFPKIENLMNGFFVVSQVLPIITLAPLFIILFGMGITSKIAIVVLMSFFPVFVSLLTGIKAIKNQKDNFLNVYQVKLSYRIKAIYIPLSFSTVVGGIKVATTMSVLGAVVAEFLGANSGLGKNLYVAPKNSMAELMMCSAILVAILGTSMFSVVKMIERKILKWEE